MNKLFLATLLPVAMVASGCSGLTGTYVHQGHVGLLVNDFSGQIEQTLDPGYRFTIPLNKHIIEYPINQQQYVMVAGAGEGQHNEDDSVKVNSSEGQAFNVDASISYRLAGKEAVAPLYQKYGKPFETIVENYYRSAFRTAVINGFASMPLAEGITTAGRKKAEAYAEQQLNTTLAADKLVVDDVMVREVHVPESIAMSIAAKTKAEAELVQSRTTAQQQVVEAEAEAKARIIRAEAEAKANKLLAASITPNLVHLKFIEKIADKIQVVMPEKSFMSWGGGMPTVAKADESK